MKFRLLIVVVLLCSQLTAQDSVAYRYGAQLRYLPTDVFVGLTLQRCQNKHQHELQFNAGITTTFFQQRFYPQISYRYTWQLVQRNYLQFGPAATLNLSMLRFNKSADHGFSFDEQLFGGIGVGTGTVKRWSLQVGSGVWIEQLWSEARNGYQSFFSWAWMAEIAYTHAF